MSQSCAQCQGNRYVILREETRSVARVCTCNDACTQCGGSGRTYVEQGGYNYVRQCPCRAVAQRVARFNQARLPARCGLTFDDFVPQNDEQETARRAAMTTAMNYRPDKPSKGFIVAGPVGSGKTHLLCAALRHLTLELNVAARYVEISFLFAEIRNGFAQGKSGLDSIMQLVDTDVLAIDELGKGRGSPFELDTLDELIARRYNTNRTTLIATNYLLADEVPRARGYVSPGDRHGDKPSDQLLRDRVGERIYSRLHEMCHMVQLPLTTGDFRRKERAAR